MKSTQISQLYNLFSIHIIVSHVKTSRMYIHSARYPVSCAAAVSSGGHEHMTLACTNRRPHYRNNITIIVQKYLINQTVI